jgi:membrane-bound lytic murein transglycosylase D
MIPQVYEFSNHFGMKHLTIGQCSFEKRKSTKFLVQPCSTLSLRKSGDSDLTGQGHKWYILPFCKDNVNKQMYFITVWTIIVLAFSLWNCASHPKTSEDILQEPPPPKIEEQITQPIEPLKEETFTKPEDKKEPLEEPEEDMPDQNDLFIEDQNEPSSLLEEASDAYRDARRAWDRGDLDTALAALDEAYSILLKIDLPQDSPLVQEKNDLRLLIARRIQEIYASQFTAINGNNRTIPLEENKHILKEIKNFQTKERKYFETAYKTSGRYISMIKKKMKNAGLPEQLAWMPMIESWFKTNAYSRARALGLWQFISTTGLRFGLKRNRWIDERMDPEKSTEAAVKYLNELHSLFGDWTTALAAYNCGEIRVKRVIRTQRMEYLDNFWDLYINLPRETARFVPRFIATLLIIENPEKYGFHLPTPDLPLEYETVTIQKPVKLSSISSRLGLETGTLAILNPELRHKSTPDQAYELKVPPGYGEKILAAVNSVSRWIPPEATYVYHYVRRGETVSGIAKRYRSSVQAIARANRLGRRYLIRRGQRLKIPVSGSTRYAKSSSRSLTREGEKLVYTVKRGDNLYVIAKSFNTTVQRIKSQNKLKNNILRVGQKLVIQSSIPEGAFRYTVKSGDTPYKIAKKYGMNLSYLLALNGLNMRSKIYPGQQIWVTSSSSND